MSVIETRDLTKRFGDRYAIRGINLELAEGDLLGYIGPNGSGKTATMRILAALSEPSWGEAYVLGLSVYLSQREIRRQIGFMPDSPIVCDRMKVIDYLESSAAEYGYSRRRRLAICNDALDWVDLGSSRVDLVFNLSRDKMQRLGLARALLNDPPLLILDEPASGLNIPSRIDFFHRLRKLRDAGKTIMISSPLLLTAAHVLRAIDILDGLEAYGIDLQNIHNQVRFPAFS